MITIKNFLLVGLGGALGAILRFLIASIWKTENFPFSTLCINILGSFVMGIVFAAAVKNDYFTEQIRLFMATGLCGGFTTFSAFSLENMLMLKSGNYLLAGIYIFASVLACTMAVFAGYKIIHY